MAHTIKAYMSAVDGWRLRCGTNQLDGLVEAALILADVEQTENARAFNVPLWDAENDGTLGGAMGILAESLASFISDEDGL